MIQVLTVTFDCADPYGLAEWWSRATGWPLVDSEPGDDAVQLDPPPDRPHQSPLLFLRVPEGKTAKNRVHLDVVPTDGRTRDEEVDRLIALGAKPYEDHRRPDGSGWMVLLDPEGNEFCVCRSPAERAAAEPAS
jgi:hypothetical protein